MKNFILSKPVLATTFRFANTYKEEGPVSISKKKKTEIIKQSNRTVYFWEVNTTIGYASGYTVSQSQAKKSIKLMAKNDVVTYKIIETYK